MSSTYLFSSESVTEGHPDKVADSLSDAILDAFLAQDPDAKVACETLVTTNFVVLAGEVSARLKQPVDFEAIVRKRIREIGYDRKNEGFNADTVVIQNKIHEQSVDIGQGIVASGELGAGDQGMMFGYACDETKDLMPAPIWICHQIAQKLTSLRKSGEVKWLRPDGKVQVTMEYNGIKPLRVHTLVLSTQHEDGIERAEIEAMVKEKILPTIPAQWMKGDTRLFVNPTGRFVIGGPDGDTGLTGRKIIVDTYGGSAPHGGGAFSGKDASKVDRSAAYMARYIAKNVVAAGLAKRFQVQISYAIGVADPVSVHLEDFGTGTVDLDKLHDAIVATFPMKPDGIREHLKLKRPIFLKSTCYGHFGRPDPDFVWEKCDLVEVLKSKLK